MAKKNTDRRAKTEIRSHEQVQVGDKIGVSYGFATVQGKRTLDDGRIEYTVEDSVNGSIPVTLDPSNWPEVLVLGAND